MNSNARCRLAGIQRKRIDHKSSSSLETVIAILLLGTVIILANSEVPINGQGYSSTKYVDDDTIKLSVEPFRPGNNIMEIEFLDSAGNPIDIRTVEMQVAKSAVEAKVSPTEIQTEKGSDGLFTANVLFDVAGEWELFIEGVRNDNPAQNIATTFKVFVRPDLDQLDFSVTRIPMPSNTSQPLFPIYDSSRNAIWVGDSALDSGRIFEYDITNGKYTEHKIKGTKIITFMALDSSNTQLWFIDPVTRVLGLYNLKTNSTQLYDFPYDRIVPSSIALQGRENTIDMPAIENERWENADGSSNDSADTVWITSPNTNEVLIFDTALGNFTNTLILPTPNSIPLGIAIDSATGESWVAEGAGKIAHIDQKNITRSKFVNITEFTPMTGALLSPTAVLIDPYTGLIYVSEHGGRGVSAFDPSLRTFTHFAPLSMDVLPFGLAIDSYRNLWVAEHVTNRIAVIDLTNEKYKEVTIPSSTPFVQYLASDNDGRIWFAEQRGNALGYITPTPRPLVVNATQ